MQAAAMPAFIAFVVLDILSARGYITTIVSETSHVFGKRLDATRVLIPLIHRRHTLVALTFSIPLKLPQQSMNHNISFIPQLPGGIS
jgi:hypothetical protein